MQQRQSSSGFTCQLNLRSDASSCTELVYHQFTCIQSTLRPSIVTINFAIPVRLTIKSPRSGDLLVGVMGDVPIFTSHQTLSPAFERCSINSSTVVMGIAGVPPRHLGRLVCPHQLLSLFGLTFLTTPVNPEGLGEDFATTFAGLDAHLVVGDCMTTGSVSGPTPHPHFSQEKGLRLCRWCGWARQTIVRVGRANVEVVFSLLDLTGILPGWSSCRKSSTTLGPEIGVYIYV